MKTEFTIDCDSCNTTQCKKMEGPHVCLKCGYDCIENVRQAAAAELMKHRSELNFYARNMRQELGLSVEFNLIGDLIQVIVSSTQQY